MILVDGGMTTSLAAVRRVLLPAGILATFGVALTAALLALFGRLMGLPWIEAMLLVRGEELVAVRGATVLNQGDHVYVFFRPEDRPFIELLFGRRESV